MTSPRYVPRDFLVEPRDFGRRPYPQWREISVEAPFVEQARQDASISQHQVSTGVRELYLRPERKKMTDLSAETQIEYHRLQKMLGGLIIMQMEDLARLRLIVGSRLDVWMMRSESAKYVLAVERDFFRKKERHNATR